MMETPNRVDQNKPLQGLLLRRHQCTVEGPAMKWGGNQIRIGPRCALLILGYEGDNMHEFTRAHGSNTPLSQGALAPRKGP